MSVERPRFLAMRHLTMTKVMWVFLYKSATKSFPVIQSKVSNLGFVGLESPQHEAKGF
jgi:hypothetical protein